MVNLKHDKKRGPAGSRGKPTTIPKLPRASLTTMRNMRVGDLVFFQGGTQNCRNVATNATRLADRYFQMKSAILIDPILLESQRVLIVIRTS